MPRAFPATKTRRCLRSIVVVAALALVASSCSGGSKSSAPSPTSAVAPAVSRPNIVFILTDDLSWDLINERFAPHIVQLQRQGETFSNYFVADSLCCPSRSTIFTGLFPHDTKVATNLPPDGGFQKFQSEGLDKKTFAVALQRAGYATSMLGKYLNGYGDPLKPKTAPVPPGWSDWHVSNSTGYAEFNYALNDNGTFNYYKGEDKYGVDVLNSYAQSFIKHAAGKPFAIEVATFAPHAPYTPAPRNANDFPGLTEPRDASFNTNNVNPPAWLGQRNALGPKQIATIDASYRKRAQAVEAVDKLVADTQATLAAEDLAKNTYIVFSSDNGYHLGQHRLNRGKQTAFDTDIRVPLIVAGPGVPADRVVPQVVQNVDLYPTFVQLAGGTPATPIEGRSLLPLLHPSGSPPPWRTVALVEHRGGNRDPADPDFEGGGSNPTTYEAIRSSTEHLPGFRGRVEAVYVEYNDRGRETEYYDIKNDPFELRNIATELTAAQRTELHKIVIALESCHDETTCWAAALPA
ncbi:MAG: sulfatase [Actinomycetota bacterium]|nr:sulfatase [Actinomycetota bacterium]